MLLYLFALGGVVIASIFHFQGVQNTQLYGLATATLLAIGLYSSTYGINVAEARRHGRLILSAITVGVFMKAAIIGTVMTLVLRNPFGYILGIILAQIDPLSTAMLLKGSRLSRRAKTILAAWASFDDPITVIMSLYAPVLVALLTGSEWRPIDGSMQAAGLGSYLLGVSLNILFALGTFAIWLGVKRSARSKKSVVIVAAAASVYILFASVFSISIYYFWMLGIAIVGLFLRPPIEKLIEHIVSWALWMAAVLLGILMINGLNIGAGVALGAAGFASQIIVGHLLARKLSWRDRWHIGFAQQNGITAIILALLFEPTYPGTIAIVGPAILTVNTLHALANRAFEAKTRRSIAQQLSFAFQLKKIKAHLSKL